MKQVETIEERLERKASAADTLGELHSHEPTITQSSLGQMSREDRHKLLYEQLAGVLDALS